jgi:predicted nucleic acid-binding protein
MTLVVVDNTVLSNFAHVEKPNLLQQAFTDLATTPAVMTELNTGEQLERVPAVDWSWLSVVTLTAEEQARVDTLHETLGLGEAECISVTKERGGLVLTDDRDARKVARSLDVAISGTLGVLMNLVRQNILTIAQADALLEAMKRRGYHSPVDSLSDLVDDDGQEI